MSDTKSFWVKTEPGGPNSLKESVRIAIVITLTESSVPEHPYGPLARTVADFNVNGEHNARSSWWAKEYNWATYSLNGRQAKWIKWSEKTEFGGTFVLDNSGNWSQPEGRVSGVGLQSRSLIAINRSGLKQNVSVGGYLAYEPLDNGGQITMSCDRKLQAYIVSKEVQEWWVLQPEDLRHPIFPTPIDCDTLPDSSTWILCQDSDGVIRLKNEKYSHLGYPPEKMAEEPPSATVQAPQLAEPTQVTEPLQATQATQLSQVLERLTVMEESISRIRDDVAVGQQAIAGMQSQISALEISAGKANVEVSGLNSKILTMETGAVALNKSFGQSQDRLSLVHKTTTDMKRLLTGLDNTVRSTNDHVLDLSRRVPAVESKCENTTLSLARSLERLSAMEGAASGTKNRVEALEQSTNQTKDQASLVQQLVVSTNNQLSLMKQIPGGVGVDPQLLVQGQAADLDRRLPAVEAQAAKMEKSLAQTQKQLASVRNALNTMDRRVPVVESKTSELENLLGKTHADLIAVQVSLAGLDHRVTALEAGSGEVDFGDDGSHDENHPSPSAQGSPFTFPSHLVEPS